MTDTWREVPVRRPGRLQLFETAPDLIRGRSNFSTLRNTLCRASSPASARTAPPGRALPRPPRGAGADLSARVDQEDIAP